MPPDYISVNFDFENKVVIFLNKKSQQTILLYGSQVAGKDPNEAESIVRFGQQLIDHFKPMSILVEESPLQIPKQESFANDQGIIFPAVSENISQLKGSDFEAFIESQVIG